MVFLPNIRLLWMPNNENSIWSSISKASRQSTRGERESKFVISPPSSATLFLPVIADANDFTKPEDLYAFDFGWRRQWASSFSTDLAGFIYRYNDSRSTQIVMPTAFPPTHIALKGGNALNVHSHGVELSTKWHPSKDWQFSFNYSWKKIKADYDGVGLFSPYVDSTPRNSLSLQFNHQINANWKLSGTFRYVDSIDVFSPLRDNGNAYHVPSYSTLDLKVNYQVSPDIKLSITGQNLLESAHKEFIDDLFASPAAEIQRSIYVGIEWNIK